MFFCLFPLISYGQEKQEIILTAAFEGDMLSLTWAPANDTIWAMGNYYGYTVTRQDIQKNRAVIASGIRPESKEWFWKE